MPFGSSGGVGQGVAGNNKQVFLRLHMILNFIEFFIMYQHLQRYIIHGVTGNKSINEKSLKV